jgi:hypothetical protein
VSEVGELTAELGVRDRGRYSAPQVVTSVLDCVTGASPYDL